MEWITDAMEAQRPSRASIMGITYYGLGEARMGSLPMDFDS
jgi:hypothetical protein